MDHKEDFVALMNQLDVIKNTLRAESFISSKPKYINNADLEILFILLKSGKTFTSFNDAYYFLYSNFLKSKDLRKNQKIKWANFCSKGAFFSTDPKKLGTFTKLRKANYLKEKYQQNTKKRYNYRNREILPNFTIPEDKYNSPYFEIGGSEPLKGSFRWTKDEFIYFLENYLDTGNYKFKPTNIYSTIAEKDYWKYIIKSMGSLNLYPETILSVLRQKIY